MMKQIHGHEVMQMMLTSGKPYTRTTLAQDIVAEFGEDARFFTCSAENMNAEELIDFLEARGKFVPADGGFQTAPDKICNH